MKDFLRFIFPHFVTEWVAIHDDGDGNLVTTMSMDCYDPAWDREPDYVIECRSFSWFGWALNPKPTGDPVAYSEWRK